MFGTDRDRIAKTKRVGIERTGFAGAALTFISDENCSFARFANGLGEDTIAGSGASPRVDQKQNRIGLCNRSRRMRLHARRQAIALRPFQAGRVDHLKTEVAELRIAFAAIPRHTGLIVDECEPAANKPVEER